MACKKHRLLLSLHSVAAWPPLQCAGPGVWMQEGRWGLPGCYIPVNHLVTLEFKYLFLLGSRSYFTGRVLNIDYQAWLGARLETRIHYSSLPSPLSVLSPHADIQYLLNTNLILGMWQAGRRRDLVVFFLIVALSVTFNLSILTYIRLRSSLEENVAQNVSI